MATDPNPDSYYPASAGDVTADRMCRYLTVRALWHAKNIESMTGTRAQSAPVFAAETTAMLTTFALVHMLRQINTVDADEFARQVYEAWEDGAHVEEMLHQWAAEYGQLDEASGEAAP
jgi:hypothetical protein